MSAPCKGCGGETPPRRTYCSRPCWKRHVQSNGGAAGGTPGAFKAALTYRREHQAETPRPETPPCTSCGAEPALPGLLDVTGPLRGLGGRCAAKQGVGARPSRGAA